MEVYWLPKHLRYMQCKAGCPKSDEHRLFRFPVKESRYKIWAEIAGIPFKSGDKQKGYYLCGRHFHRNQFRDSSRTSTIYSAVPTITREQWECENKRSAVGADTENQGGQTSPPENAGNSMDVTVGVDSEKSSCPVIPPSVSRNETSDSNHEDKKSSCTLLPPSVSRDETVDPKHEAEKSSYPVIPPSVSGDETGESHDEADDYMESATSASLDPLISAQVFDSNKGKQISLLESVSNEKTIPLLNDYYRYTLCRLCFCSSKALIGIFEESLIYGFMISDAIKDLLRFKVSRADDFPQFICFQCLDNLMEFKKYKDKLCKLRGEFEESLQKLRKNTGDVIVSGQSDSPLVEEQEESKNADSGKDVNELREMTDGYSSENSENCSLPEDAISDLEDSGSEGLDLPETRIQEKEVKEKVIQEEYKCMECGKIFEFKNLLLIHRREHQKQWAYACGYCDKRFKTLMNLNSHIIVHSNYRPYECEHCGLRCRLKKTLANHKMIHSGDKPYLCSVCGMTFRDRTQLMCHMKVHSGVKGYKCLECGLEFFSSKKLSMHIASHNKEKPHVCGDCGKSFKESGRLINHVTCVHQKEKRFKCGICSKLFSLRLYLRNHMKIHKRNMT